jgi:predicted secreted protein
MAVKVVTQADSGTNARLTVGDVLEVRLSERPNGYVWTISTLPKLSAVVSEQFEAPDPLVPGAAGQHVWHIKANNPGSEQLSFAHRRPWEGTKPPSQTFELTLIVS